MITHASLTPELDCELVAFYGELDAAAAPDLDARMGEATAPPAKGLLVDLCGCTFIDSLGIAAVIGGVRTMLERDRPAAVACSSPQVRSMLALTGVDKLVAVYRTREEAVTALAGSPGS
jgi:anti-anti-sigma factor